MLPDQITRTIQAFSQLPGIGPKTAERLTFYLLKGEAQKTKRIADALSGLHEALKYCQQCWNFSVEPLCVVCQNPSRSSDIVCVVEDPMDVVAIEKTGVFKGLYHVLHGAISPIDGVGPEQLTIKPLQKRLESSVVSEIVLATNPTVTGEATAMFLRKILKPSGVNISHLAQGMPMGGQLEFVDPSTLKRAFQGRVSVNE